MKIAVPGFSYRRKPEFSATARLFLSYLLFPSLLGSGLLITGLSWNYGGWYAGTVAMMATYWAWVGLIVVLERSKPFEPAWNDSDGQLINDLSYATLLQHAVNPLNAGLLWMIAWLAAPLAVVHVWPEGWSPFITIPLGILVYDLGFYFAHRWMHEVPLLWRFHIIHHSSARLSVLNAGRAHPVNNLLYTLCGLPIPVLLGIPHEVAMWHGALVMWGGALTHSNIGMRCGVFNYIVNTPQLHRWHHSRHQPETDINYGEATVFWDHVFGTFRYPARLPPRNVGIDTSVSSNLLLQLIQPFTPAGHRSGQRTITALHPRDADEEREHSTLQSVYS